MRIGFLYRKPTPIGHSIEGIFDVLCDEFNSGYERRSIVKHFAPYSSRSLLRLWRNISYAKGIKADVIHVTGDIHYVSLGLNRSRTVLTIHDCVPLFKGMPVVKKNLIKLLWYTLPVRHLKWITVISEKTKNELVHLTGCDPNKITVIPNCYNPVFKFSTYPDINEKPIILQIGTKPNKNINRLIDSIVGLECILDIVGPVDKTLLNLLREKSIDFRHSANISTSEMLKKYGACHLVMFISTYEGFGMPVIESQVVGRPVVTSNIEPMKSVAGTGACLVDPYDTVSIRDGINRILSDLKYRNDLIVSGLKNAKRFETKEIADMYLKLYEKMQARSLTKGHS